YDSFGNTLSMSGPMADANLYRFSSKELHAASGLIYYLYRYYETSLQGWLNRDPIEEEGRFNLYTFSENSPVSVVDLWGLDLMPINDQPDPFCAADCQGQLQDCMD